jgi:hypothetical protein
VTPPNAASAQVREFSEPTADALDKFIALVVGGATTSSPDFKRFGEWFVQGQQYLSFIRGSGQTLGK